MTCGIYAIRNKINNLCYIGSSLNIKLRWEGHSTNLKYGKHRNKYLQNAWNKYGRDNFEFIILKETSPEERFTIEQSYIDWFKSYLPEFGYNLLKSTQALKPVSLETKLKIAKSKIGKKRSWKTTRRMSASMKAAGVARKFDKWPCEDAHRCLCEKCSIKKKQMRIERNAARQERGHNLLRASRT